MSSLTIIRNNRVIFYNPSNIACNMGANLRAYKMTVSSKLRLMSLISDGYYIRSNRRNGVKCYIGLKSQN